MSKPNYEMYEIVTANFRQAMIKELAANFDKGDRELPNGWLSMTPKQFCNELYYHVGKLQAALKANDLDLIKELSADIANGALMVYDKYSSLLESQPQQKEQFSREFICGFAQWLDKSEWYQADRRKIGNWTKLYTKVNRALTTDQLLTEYLNSKTKPDGNK